MRINAFCFFCFCLRLARNLLILGVQLCRLRAHFADVGLARVTFRLSIWRQWCLLGGSTMSYYDNSFERLGLPISQDSIIYIGKLHEIWNQDLDDSRGLRADFSGGI